MYKLFIKASNPFLFVLGSLYFTIHLGVSDPPPFQRVHWVQLKFGLEIIIIAYEKHFSTNTNSFLATPAPFLAVEAWPKLFGPGLELVGMFLKALYTPATRCMIQI